MSYDYRFPYITWPTKIESSSNRSIDLRIDATSETVQIAPGTYYGLSMSDNNNSAASDSIAGALAAAFLTHSKVSACTAEYTFTENGWPRIKFTFTRTAKDVGDEIQWTSANTNVDPILFGAADSTDTSIGFSNNEAQMVYSPDFVWHPKVQTYGEREEIENIIGVSNCAFSNNVKIENYSQKVQKLIFIPTVSAARIFLFRRQQTTFANKSGQQTGDVNNLFENLFTQSATIDSSLKMRFYRAWDDYFDFKIVDEGVLSTIQDSLDEVDSGLFYNVNLSLGKV